MKSQPRSNSRLKKQRSPQPKASFFQSFQGYLTNFSYKLKSIKMPFRPASPPSCLSANGRRFSSLEDCLKHHQALLWFTYRKNCKINLTIGSDMGWGCMLRTAQMLLAQALRAYFHQRGVYPEPSYIVSAFLESETKSKYTIDRFMQMAGTLYHKNAGDWFSITEVALMLQQLHSETPLKGAQRLSIEVCHEMIDPETVRCLLSTSPASSLERQRSYKLFKKKPVVLQTKLDSLERSVLLMVTARLGNRHVLEPEYQMLLELMLQPSFVGAMGGAPKRARFLTGRNGDKISYLDPHHVGEQIERLNLERQMQKFHSQDYWLMDKEKLDPDLALCFLVGSHEQLESLLGTIEELNSKHNTSFIRAREARGQEKGREVETSKEERCESQQFEDLYSISSLNSSFLMD